MKKNKGESQRPPSNSLSAFLILPGLLIACSDGQMQTAPDSGSQVSATGEELESRYREKVKRRVSASVVSSFAREWNVSEPKVECVLADLKVTELDDAATDATVAAVFEECGVDPSFVR